MSRRAPIPKTEFLDGKVTLYGGDCIKVLRSLPENSVDSCVVDPPYHMTSIVKRFGKAGSAAAKAGKTGAFKRASAGFMGQQWDGGDIAFKPSVWRQVLRVLKPGGYLLAFASTRGFGRMSVAIEDAGFITHPLIAWVFGSGFPKATRIKAEGYDDFRYGGQALKPAIEPIYMGQKPFSEATGTANILLHGTGALNIGKCRVETDGPCRSCGHARLDHDRQYFCSEDGCECDGYQPPLQKGVPASVRRAAQGPAYGNLGNDDGKGTGWDQSVGRWPANLIHDGSDEVVAAFPEAPGQQQDIDIDAPSNKTDLVYGKMNRHGEKSADRRYTERGATDFAALPGMRRNDSGSAARFFYSSKADAEDRAGSKHPTVKPLDLIQYLCRLITPPHGIVLDCFAGTGTTGEAAWREGFKAILIEREEEYQADIARRMDLAVKPAKRAAVAKTKGKLQGADGTPLFGDQG